MILRIEQLQAVRQFAFLGPAQGKERCRRIGFHIIVIGQGQHAVPLAAAEFQNAFGLDGVKGKGREKIFQRIPRRHGPLDHEAIDEAGAAIDFNRAQAIAAANFRDEPVEPHSGYAPVQPVAARIVDAIGPDIGARRECRKGPGVPGPEEHPLPIHHGLRHTRRKPDYGRPELFQ